MTEFVPGARTEGGEEKEENSVRFQKIHSPVCKRPMCDKRGKRKRQNKTERERERSFGENEAFPKGLLFTKCC